MFTFMNPELKTLINNLKQTEDPIEEIFAQKEFLARQKSEGKITIGEYIRRSELLTAASRHFREKDV